MGANMNDFAPATAHGPIEAVFPNVHMVTGTVRMGFAMVVTRNMTIVRQGAELTVLNAVRLSPEGEAALDALGTVKHVLRLGNFHGMDDPYYVHRYGAKLWSPPGMKPGAVAPTDELKPGSCPIEGATVFLFEKGRVPEAALVLPQDGGVLIPCDAYQNWTTFAGCSWLIRITAPMMGFGPTHIGGPWTKGMGLDVRADFTRLLELPFHHLIPAHGTVLRDTAKEGLRVAIEARFK